MPFERMCISFQNSGMRGVLKMINVCVNGYGTIGKRVADAVSKHPKMKLVGVTKYTPDQDAKLAVLAGMTVFVRAESVKAFEAKGIKPSGTTEELIKNSDTIVDASSDGNGSKNKQNTYLVKKKKAIFQGGEEANIGFSFNARCNFDLGQGKDYIRGVSCNTTSYCRIIKPIAEQYKIKHIDALLIRRGADLNDAKGSALNAVDWKAKSHHADDIRSVIDVPISSIAFKVPHTHCHLNSMRVTFDGSAPAKDEIYSMFKNERVAVLNTASTSSQIIEAARDIGLKRFDTFMPALLMNTFMSNGNDIFISFAVPQESIVVPENIDAVIAQASLMDRNESMKLTYEILNLNKIKSQLENIFS